MKRSLKVLIFVFAFLISRSAVSCTWPSIEDITNYKDFIKNTNNIVLARNNEIKLVNNGTTIKYTFKVIKVIKGKYRSKIDIYVNEKNSYFNSEVRLDDFNSHSDPEFWDWEKTRIQNAADCKMYPVFDIGKNYLIFLNKPDHYGNYELIRSPEDRWLSAVVKYVSQQNKQVSK